MEAMVELTTEETEIRHKPRQTQEMHIQDESRASDRFFGIPLELPKDHGTEGGGTIGGHQAVDNSIIGLRVTNGASRIETEFSSAPSSEQENRAYTIKIANRKATANMSPGEVEALSKEKATLVDRKFLSGLTGNEERRLRLVDWHLGRYEEAQIGHGLDILDVLLERQKSLREDLDGFNQAVKELKSRVDRSDKRKRRL